MHGHARFVAHFMKSRGPGRNKCVKEIEYLDMHIYIHLGMHRNNFLMKFGSFSRYLDTGKTAFI